jgi:hypothetical protein
LNRALHRNQQTGAQQPSSQLNEPLGITAMGQAKAMRKLAIGLGGMQKQEGYPQLSVAQAPTTTAVRMHLATSETAVAGASKQR